MGLKGGKVLLDLSDVDLHKDGSNQISVDDTTLKAISEKGLELLVTSGGVKFIYPFIPFDFSYDSETGKLYAISSENQNSAFVIQVSFMEKYVRISEL